MTSLWRIQLIRLILLHKIPRKIIRSPKENLLYRLHLLCYRLHWMKSTCVTIQTCKVSLHDLTYDLCAVFKTMLYLFSETPLSQRLSLSSSLTSSQTSLASSGGEAAGRTTIITAQTCGDYTIKLIRLVVMISTHV